ncbi:MAG: hypothetical protein WDN23_15290 [Edaphobacter sp.]
MSLLKTKPDAKSHEDRSAHRIFPVTAKLTKDERKAVTDFARSQGFARGQWMRDVILRELRGAPASDISLAEILASLAARKRPATSGRRSKTYTRSLRQIAGRHQRSKARAGRENHVGEKEITRWQRPHGDARKQSSGRTTGPLYTYGTVFVAVVLTGLFLCARLRFGNTPFAAVLHARL